MDTKHLNLYQAASQGLVPRFCFGKLIYRENSVIKEEIFPFLKRYQRLRLLFCLNRSSRLFIARNMSRVMQTEWSYQDVSQGIRNFDATLSNFVKEDKKYLFGGPTNEEIAFKFETSGSYITKKEWVLNRKQKRFSIDCSVLLRSTDERGFIFLIGNDWSCHECGPKGKLFWKASFLPN
jgi:hypothetical protein